jgi:hypothetical protein
LNELVSGLGDEPQQTPQLGTNAAPSESLPTEDVSATGQKQ